MGSPDQLTEPREQSAFAAVVQRHRGELQVHCYRMLGSLEDAEDLVQETFLRAWRSRERFRADGRLSFRAWLYRIATNACLDVLRTRSRRVMPPDVVPAGDPTVLPLPPADLPWLQPYPDRLLEYVTAPEEEPGAVVVARETIKLTFIAAIQHLPPRQRAVLLLRDVLGWSAKETALLLETSVVSANSALQRARATLRHGLGETRTEWRSGSELAAEERGLLRRYIEAHERADVDALAALLREEARLTMPPHPTWFEGRARSWSHQGRASTPRSANCGACPPGRTASRAPPTTCGRRARRTSKRWRSTCCGSRTAGSPRSPRSSTQRSSPRSACR
jgi:RNA polymerase sigma-70 factor (ECF subfamily)